MQHQPQQLESRNWAWIVNTYAEAKQTFKNASSNAANQFLPFLGNPANCDYLRCDLHQPASRQGFQQQGGAVWVQPWKMYGLKMSPLYVQHTGGAFSWKAESQVGMVLLSPVCLYCHQPRSALQDTTHSLAGQACKKCFASCTAPLLYNSLMVIGQHRQTYTRTQPGTDLTSVPAISGMQ